MIIIKAPTAQNAADTLSLKPPPALTVRAEYGGFVLEGQKYTSAHQQAKGSPYSKENPPPHLDRNIPLLKETEVALIKEIDIETIVGLMRAEKKYEEYLKPIKK